MLSLRSNFMREVLYKDSSGKATVGEAGAACRHRRSSVTCAIYSRGTAVGLRTPALGTVVNTPLILCHFDVRICTFLLFSSFSKGDELDVKPILIISWIIEACMAVEGDCCFILLIYLSFLIIKYLFTWLSDALTRRVDSTEVHLAPVL